MIKTNASFCLKQTIRNNTIFAISKKIEHFSLMLSKKTTKTRQYKPK